MNQTSKSQTLGNTFNLQTKRTLPRDVIKWMQGLDLSYSVKDYRKDLVNGFLFGEIVSRYQPGKIPMHAFQNSQNQDRKDNNWNLLALFFNKNQIRKVKIEQNEYAKIKNGTDPKSQQLYQFICRLYTVCTKRNLPEAGQTIQLPPTQSKNPNLTASYLLKDDRLEKLQNSQISQNSHNETEKAAEDRVPTRKISPSMNSPARVDVKGIGVKQENRKATSKRKSWQAKSQSFYEQSNEYSEKYVFDYLNQILSEQLGHQQGISTELRELFEKSDAKPTETFIKNLPFETKFVVNFFQSVKSAVNQILTVMLKDLNEIWKFFNYFIKFFSYFEQTSEEFSVLFQLIITYATGSNLNEKKKVNKVFMQSIIDGIISEVKRANDWKKKQKIMQTVYDFSGRQNQDKKAVLFSLKQKLGSNSPLYFQWLTVLVREQKNSSSSQKLLEDFIYYAHQQLASSNSSLRLFSLKILSIVASNGWIGMLEQFLLQQITMRKFRNVSDFESAYLASVLYTNLLKNIVQSNQYQSLAKGKNQGNSNSIKVYNPDHQKQTAEIKQKVHNVAFTIASLYHNTTSQITREIIAKESVSFIGQSSVLMLVVVYHMGFLRRLEQFFKQEQFVYEFKTTQVSVAPVKVDILKQNANDMLSQLLKLHENKRNQNFPDNADLTFSIEQQLALVDFCLENINIKKLNIQLWEQIGQKLIKGICELLKNESFSAFSWTIVKRTYSIVFNFDLKMPYLNVWLSQSLSSILQDGGAQGNQIVQNVKNYFREQYQNASIQQIRISADEINDGLEDKGHSRIIKIGHE